MTAQHQVPNAWVLMLPQRPAALREGPLMSACWSFSGSPGLAAWLWWLLLVGCGLVVAALLAPSPSSLSPATALTGFSPSEWTPVPAFPKADVPSTVPPPWGKPWRGPWDVRLSPVHCPHPSLSGQLPRHLWAHAFSSHTGRSPQKRCPLAARPQGAVPTALSVYVCGPQSHPGPTVRLVFPAELGGRVVVSSQRYQSGEEHRRAWVGPGQSCIRDRHGMGRWGWSPASCACHNPLMGDGWDPAILQELICSENWPLCAHRYVLWASSSVWHGCVLLRGRVRCAGQRGSRVQNAYPLWPRCVWPCWTEVCQHHALLRTVGHGHFPLTFACFAVLEIVFRAACFGQKVTGKSIPIWPRVHNDVF